MNYRPKSRTHQFGFPIGGGWVAVLVLTAFVILLFSAEGCSGGFRGYRAMAKAARSELSAAAQARDQRLKLQLRQAILLDQTYDGLTIFPYVYMERGFVVGRVEDSEQANGIMDAARTVQGLRSLYGYLPVGEQVNEEKEETSGSLFDITISTEVKANLALVPDIVSSQIDINVLAGNVVLLGVVASEDVKNTAEREARRVSGVTGVTNLLLLPEREYMKRRPRVLR